MKKSSLNQKILALVSALHSDCGAVADQSLRDALSTPELVDAIKKTGMAGYFCALLDENRKRLGIAPSVIEELKVSTRRTAAKNVFYEAQCARLLCSFSSRGIPHILLKGLSYMEDVFGDISARTMSDIDLLIRPDDRLRALEVLLEESYAVYFIPLFQGPKEDFHKLTDLIGEAHFVKKSGALTINIDLHWKLRPGYPMSDYLHLDKLPWWENTTSVVIGDAPAKRLSPDMQFLHLALHLGLHHQYTGLRWFVEFCLFLKRYGHELAWDNINALAGSKDCRKLVGICLKLAEDYMGASWPGVAQWKNFLSADALLPGEYPLYRHCVLRDSRSRFASYLCMALFPATIRGRMEMIRHFLFDPEGVSFWHGTGKKLPKGLQIFYGLYIVGRQMFAGRRAASGKP